ncbi:MAG: di-trans,poly-cis-decaprenylcistransferase [Candidatus Andersenbacteria bacterium]|nr:di-trans,poly-cis-decaprenylcistransferase [Candidatus Andersenbacteria bacterium]
MSMSIDSVPRHVAIIPDSNRRWAKAQGKGASFGHEAGAKMFKPVALLAAEKGIEHMSLWGLSLNNFSSRSPVELAALLRIFQEYFENLKDDADIHRLQIKIQAFGRWQEKFPASLVNAIEAAQAATAHYPAHTMNFFLAYNGTDEMMAAVQAIADSAKEKDVQVTPELIKQHLFTKDLPPVDLVIRTGGEPHLSTGFMMWDIADAELYFSDKLWPEFTTDEFAAALDWYKNRERRLGK